MTWNKGYGVTNYTIQRKLKDMDKNERESFEKQLKKNNPKRYNDLRNGNK